MKTLILIPFHYDQNRIKYLNTLVSEYTDNYKADIIIDTNAHEDNPFGNKQVNYSSKVKHDCKISIFVHDDLRHPFHLTLMHRLHILDEIDNYDWFMYVESDILLPFENFLNYTENFKLLYPKYIPSFVRIETKDEQEFLVDQTEPDKLEIITISGKDFCQLKQPYHGFWIMPHLELKESFKNRKSWFCRTHDSRETASSYPMWELKKTPLVEIENGMISEKSKSYHLPNNYTEGDSAHGKIRVENLFI